MEIDNLKNAAKELHLYTKNEWLYTLCFIIYVFSILICIYYIITIFLIKEPLLFEVNLWYHIFTISLYSLIYGIRKYLSKEISKLLSLVDYYEHKDFNKLQKYYKESKNTLFISYEDRLNWALIKLKNFKINKFNNNFYIYVEKY